MFKLWMVMSLVFMMIASSTFAGQFAMLNEHEVLSVSCANDLTLDVQNQNNKLIATCIKVCRLSLDVDWGIGKIQIGSKTVFTYNGSRGDSNGIKNALEQQAASILSSGRCAKINAAYLPN